MEALGPLLAAHPFFKGLEEHHLKLVEACASKMNFAAGQFLCRGTEEATRFYLVLQGRVAVEIYRARRGPLTTQTVNAGEALGWLWVEKPYHWHVDARALELTRVISLDVHALMRRCEENHELGYELMKRYTHLLAVQFRVTILQLADIYG